MPTDPLDALANTPQLKPKPKNAVFIRIFIAVTVILIAVGVYWFLHRGQESTDDAAVEATVVTISPKVAGYLKALHIDDNQQVAEGELLVEIDPADYLLAQEKAGMLVEVAKSRYEASSQNLSTTKVSAPSQVSSAQSQVAAAQAVLRHAQLELKRQQSLSAAARNQVDVDAAIAEEKSAAANLRDVQAKLQTAQTAPQTVAAATANTNEAQAQISLANNNLASANQNLAYTKIATPIAGRITNKGVEQGDYLQVGQPLFSVVSNDPWIIANFKETQLTHMRVGQRVEVKVDAFPDRKFTGKVDSIQAGTGARFSLFPAENATGNFVKIVQRVPVKIVLDHVPDEKLPIGPGMSVVPTVMTAE